MKRKTIILFFAVLNTVFFLLVFLNTGKQAQTTSQKRAEKIMERRFFGIDDAVEYFGVEPTEDQLKALSRIPFSKEVLKENKITHVLVAVFPLSIVDIKERVDSTLFDQTHEWYYDDFFGNEKGKACWKLVRMTPVEGSKSKYWREQQFFITENEEVPTAQIMVYTIIGYYLKYDWRMFEKSAVITSSTDQACSHIAIGYFRVDLGIYGFWDSNGNSGIGLASVRKPWN